MNYFNSSKTNASTLSPLKKEVLQELTDSVGQLTPEKALPLVLKANLKLKKHGEAFTKEELNHFIDELTPKLSEKDQSKIALLKKLW